LIQLKKKVFSLSADVNTRFNAMEEQLTALVAGNKALQKSISKVEKEFAAEIENLRQQFQNGKNNSWSRTLWDEFLGLSKTVQVLVVIAMGAVMALIGWLPGGQSQ